MPPLRVFREGLSCPKCSDGLSYPEKFIYNLLDQLILEFEKSKIFNWSNNKIYDYYIPSLNCIIEAHGEQHYNGNFRRYGGRSLEEEQENDRLKEILAKENGIEKYIIIDCRNSELEWIKHYILNSELSAIFDLSKINWLKCHEYASNSLVKVACDLWSKGITSTTKIGRLLNLERHTVSKYLKKGKTIGLVNNYTGESVYNPKGVVKLSLDRVFICKYNSIKEASKSTGIAHSRISGVCNKRRKTAGGYIWIHEDEFIEMIRGVYMAKRTKKPKETLNQNGVSDIHKDRTKLILDEDKTLLDNYYNWLLKYYPIDRRSELIKIHEEMMIRRQREIDELKL